MLPKFFSLYLFIWLLPCFICAQQVPQKIQDFYLSTAAKNGQVLEKKILPDFNRAHPTQLFINMPCFPGKKITASVLMATKPGDLKLKINIGKQEFLPKTDYLELPVDGVTYYSRAITLDMTNVTNTSENCMEVIAYDQNNIDLPVYLYFFSFK